jgi:hypothetical protein
MDAQIRKKMEEYGKTKFGIEILPKEDSWLMKLFSYVLFFNKKFMTYITTVGKKIYFPKHVLHGDDRSFWHVLAHEIVHAYDGRGWRFFHFAVFYLSPQIFALGFILAFFVSWWFLLFLVLLAPLPSYGRFYYEMRGYATSMAVMKWSGTEIDSPPQWVVEQFTTSFYYWMWPFKGHVRSTLQGWIKKIDDGTIQDDIPVLGDLKAIISEHIKQN